MVETADVVVIGGGVNGTSIAYALAARKAGRVVMLEKAAVANGASGRSSALVRMHYSNETDARLAWASFPMFLNWSDVIGGPPVFTHTGFVTVVPPTYTEALEKNVEMLRGIGVNTRSISPAELKALQPFVNADDIGAVAYEPDSGYANPADVVEGFRRRAQELGGRMLQWTTVTKILRSGNRVTGVETSAGRFEAGAVVVAAGAWAPRLFGEIGVELPARVKGVDSVVVTRPPELATPHLIFIDHVQGTYFRPESGILTIVGVPCPVYDLDPDGALALPPQAPAEGAQILTHRIPAMERATLARGYRAFDCYSRDRHAILGAVDGVEGLYLATGFSGSGFKIAPAVGACMAELILDGKAKTVDIEPFSLRRFAEGRSPDGPYPYPVRRDYLDLGGRS